MAWLLALCAGSCEAAEQWRLTDAAVRPGETAHVELRVRHDGEVLPGSSLRVIVHGRQVLVSGGIVESGGGMLCSRTGESVVQVQVVQPPAHGAEQLVCRIPVRTYPDAFRETSYVAATRTCPPGESCEEVARSNLLVDAPAHWRERALIVIPRPEGPSQAALLAFDYANPSASAPLRTFETPRPADVAHAFEAFPAGSAFAKSSVPPNPAVAALLRSVRAIYRDETARAAAQTHAAQDGDVEGVLADAWYGMRIWPTQPIAGEPFALWHAAPVCTPVVPQHFDEREVAVAGDQVVVTVRDNQMVDFASCPDGEIHALLNMPGLPAGTYRLSLRSVSAFGEATEQASIPLIVRARGSAAAPAIHAVPGSSLPALVLLVLAFTAAGGARRQENPSSS